MGLKDRVGQLRQAHQEALDARHYDATVNKKGLSMSMFTATLNQRWTDGWGLAHVFEQDGNTVMVWERRDSS